MTTVSKAEFYENADRTLEAAVDGPVFITEHGKPTRVLLSIEEYQRIKSQPRSLADALSMPGLSDIEPDIPDFRDRPTSIDFP